MLYYFNKHKLGIILKTFICIFLNVLIYYYLFNITDKGKLLFISVLLIPIDLIYFTISGKYLEMRRKQVNGGGD